MSTEDPLSPSAVRPTCSGIGRSARTDRRTTAETVIVPYPDGPLVVRGPVRLVDEHGREVEIHRRAVALCRCGRSRLGALCDGTHRAIGFRAAGRSAAGRP